jgi:hypothetical protein
MEYSATKKNEIMLFAGTWNGTGEHYAKWSKPGSKG